MNDNMQSSDPTISRKVGEQLSNRGMQSPCHIVVETRKGRVTLSGAIQYEYQRRIAVKATSSVAGVQSVQDQMHVIPKKAPISVVFVPSVRIKMQETPKKATDPVAGVQSVQDQTQVIPNSPPAKPTQGGDQ